MKLRTNRARLNLEPLEIRATPATMVNSTTLTYQDVDGDNVRVTFSKPILTAGDVNSIFTFGAGNVNGSNAAKQQLMLIDLMNVANASGTGITVTATASPTNGGDGLAAIGEINATGLNLGSINIGGDLGAIEAGAGNNSTAVGGLTVQSMGRYGTSTGATNLNSLVNGKLPSLSVRADVRNVDFGVAGSIGSIVIGGSLLGGSAALSGVIESLESIGTISVKGDIVGGASDSTGDIITQGGASIGSVNIGGSLRGGGGSTSGVVGASKLGTVTIGGDIVGGDGSESGVVLSQTTIAGVTVAGSIRGGTSDLSGSVVSGSFTGSTIVKGQIIGGSGPSSGVINAGGGTLGNVIVGSLRGGKGAGSGVISSKLDMGTVTINGDVLGGSGDESGEVRCAGKLAGVSVSGSLVGGAGTDSGTIISQSVMGNVTISGSLEGGDGFGSGVVFGISKLSNVTINGYIVAGSGPDSGRVSGNSDAGQIRVGGNVFGLAAGVFVAGRTTSLTVGGSIDVGAVLSSQNGFGNLVVGGDVEGEIDAGGTISTLTIAGSLEHGKIIDFLDIGNLTINGDIAGQSASGSVSLSETGYIQAMRIANLTVGGSLVAGVDNTTGTFSDNGAIQVVNDIGNLTVKGNIKGDATNSFLITARGSQSPTATADLAIGSIDVKGDVEFASILGGFDINNGASDADAQIGTVTVAGDWVTSSIATGTTPGFGPYYGTSLDKKMSGNNVKDVPALLSKIASIAIGGQALGTPGGFDSFGFVAEQVGSVKINNVPIPLHAGAHNDAVAIGITDDFNLREI
jgi:hypothetical protein